MLHFRTLLTDEKCAIFTYFTSGNLHQLKVPHIYLEHQATLKHTSWGTPSHPSPLVLHGTFKKNQAPGQTWKPHPHLSTPPLAHTPASTCLSSGYLPKTLPTSMSHAQIWHTFPPRKHSEIRAADCQQPPGSTGSNTLQEQGSNLVHFPPRKVSQIRPADLPRAALIHRLNRPPGARLHTR